MDEEVDSLKENGVLRIILLHVTCHLDGIIENCLDDLVEYIKDGWIHGWWVVLQEAKELDL